MIHVRFETHANFWALDCVSGRAYDSDSNSVYDYDSDLNSDSVCTSFYVSDSDSDSNSTSVPVSDCDLKSACGVDSHSQTHSDSEP